MFVQTGMCLQRINIPIRQGATNVNVEYGQWFSCVLKDVEAKADHGNGVCTLGGMAPIDSHMIDEEVSNPLKTERTSYSSMSSFIGKPLPPKTLVVFRGSVGSVREECSLIGSWNLPTVVLDSTHLFQAAADLCCQRFPQLLRRTPHFQWLCYSGGLRFIPPR